MIQQTSGKTQAFNEQTVRHLKAKVSMMVIYLVLPSLIEVFIPHLGNFIVFVAHTMYRGPWEVTLETATVFDRNAATVSSTISSAQLSPQHNLRIQRDPVVLLAYRQREQLGQVPLELNLSERHRRRAPRVRLVGGASGGPQASKSSAMRHHWSVTASSAVSLNSKPKHKTLVLENLGHAAGPS